MVELTTAGVNAGDHGTVLALVLVLTWALVLVAIARVRAWRQGDRPARPRELAVDELFAASAPPEADRSWRAEITWQDRAEGGARFVVWAEADGEDAVVASSPPLRWPPTDEAAIRSLHEAVQRLETRLLADGWTAEAVGTHWYARRFTWTEREQAHQAARETVAS